MKATIRILAVLAVVLVGLSLRLRAVDLLPVDYDEPIYFLAGQHYAPAMVAGDWSEIARYEYNLEHPPLAKLAYGAALAFLPQIPEIPKKPISAPPPASLPDPHFRVSRLVSAAFGTLEVLVLALLNPLAGLFLAIHTFTIKYTSQIYLEALPSLTSAIAVLAYARWQTVRNTSKRPLAWLALSAAALGLTAASKYLFCIAGIAVVLHWLWQAQKDRDMLLKQLGLLLGWSLLAVLAFIAADPFLWSDPIGNLKSSILFNVDYSQSTAVQDAGLPVWQPFVWLLMSVPWHPGVFVIAFDALISLFALFGLRRVWNKQPVFLVWLVVGLVFLLIWSTKWPQYILMIIVPLTLVSAEGFCAIIWEPLVGWLKRLASREKRQIGGRSPSAWLRTAWRESRRAIPWLLTGTIVLGLIALFPMFFQVAMGLTDFSATAIRDGLTGGVWREARLGLTGQVKPIQVELFDYSTSKQVHYAGPSLFLQILSGAASELLVFNILWTVLSVSLQTGLGVAVALMLNRQGVRFKGWWRTIFILPWAIPEFVGAVIWAQTFDPRFGWFNLITASWSQRADFPGAAGLASQWQDHPGIALVVLLIAATWYGFPFMLLATTAGLKLIPHEVYDAAVVDGANAWRQFQLITWPMLLPLLVPAIIIRSIFAFNQFYLFYVLQPPFPLSTFSITSFFFFSEVGQYAVSAVLNLFTVVALAVLILLFNRWSKAAEGVTYA
jgi:ABC-type sugar transport system permease subunit